MFPTIMLLCHFATIMYLSICYKQRRYTSVCMRSFIYICDLMEQLSATSNIPRKEIKKFHNGQKG